MPWLATIRSYLREFYWRVVQRRATLVYACGHERISNVSGARIVRIDYPCIPCCRRSRR